MSTLALFFDTETTGIVHWKKSPVDPAQPNLVQLGAQLIELETRRILHTIDAIVTPAGEFTIPDGAANVHKITTELAERVGIFREHAVLPFRDMLASADYVVAHNFRFDKIIMERASAQVDLHFGVEVADLWLPKNKPLCTMQISTPIVKKRSKRPLHNQDYVWPKLSEALKFFTGKDIVGAHNAIVDVEAAIDIFYALLERGHLDGHLDSPITPPVGAFTNDAAPAEDAA